MASTLLLDRSANDLALDALGNIALATEPYSQLQDVASACKTFAGECYYDTTIGVPYFDQVFNGATPIQILKARMVEATKTVPGVVGAAVALGTIDRRSLSGQVQVTLADGTTLPVSI